MAGIVAIARLLLQAMLLVSTNAAPPSDARDAVLSLPSIAVSSVSSKDVALPSTTTRLDANATAESPPAPPSASFSCGVSEAMVLSTHTMVLLAFIAVYCRLAWQRCQGQDTRVKLESGEQLKPRREKPKGRMAHFDSLRFIIAMVIALFHAGILQNKIPTANEPSTTEDPSWISALMSWNVAYVSFFIVLSGFVTEWTSAPGLALAPFVTLGQYYTKRLTRVLLVTWVTLSYTLALCVNSPEGNRVPGDHSLTLSQVTTGHIIALYLQLYSWVEPWHPLGHAAFFNVPIWTVHALMRPHHGSPPVGTPP